MLKILQSHAHREQQLVVVNVAEFVRQRAEFVDHLLGG
jgi:hypothetical protein